MADEDWKNEHANRSEEAVAHPLVQSVIAEFADNMGFELTGLPKYGLAKVALYAAQVARAQALSFDPELLRLTPDEANAELMALAARATIEGVPTTIITAMQIPACTSAWHPTRPAKRAPKCPLCGEEN